MFSNLNKSLLISFYFLGISVAPMMEWTNNHFRTLARLISKHAWLYTEMIAAETIIYQSGHLVTDQTFFLLYFHMFKV